MKKDLLANAGFYYQVGDFKSFSKNECFIVAKGDASKISFYQQNDIWDNVDLATEPEQSFDKLCEENCRRFRQKYDHICLWLSSGYDSQTALKSFIRANVIIDEIAYYDRRAYYADPELPFIEHSIKIYKEFYNPNLKINAIKIDTDYHENFYNKHAESVWYTGPGSNLRYTKSTASYIHNFHDNYLKSKIHEHKRVDIYGKDKPKLDLRDGKWYLQSNDLVFYDMIGAPVECFYCNSLLPELHVKQIHLAIRYFENLPGINHSLVHQVQSNDPIYYEQWNLSIGRLPVECIESRDARVKSNFGNTLESKDATQLVQHLEKTNKQIEYFKGYRSDFLNDLGDHSINLHQMIFGKDWYIKDFDAN